MLGGCGNMKIALSYWRVLADSRPIKATTKSIAMHIAILHSVPKTRSYRTCYRKKYPCQGSDIISVSLIGGGGGSG
jgi:hypothetical protein